MNLYIKDATKRLLANFKQLSRPGTAYSIVFYFSKLIAKRKSDNFGIVINMIKDSLKQYMGDIFVLDNSDIIVVYHGKDINVIEKLIHQVHYMFSDDDNIALDDLMHGQFYQTYAKDDNWDEFITYCKNLLDLLPSKQSSIIDAYNSTLDQYFQKINWSDAILKTNIFRFKLGSKNQVVMQELVCNTQILEVLAGNGFDVLKSKALTHFVRERIDIQLLIFAMQMLDKNISEPLIINIMLETARSPEFDAFVSFVSSKNSRKVIIAIDIGQVLSDFPTWLSIRERLACLDIETMLDSVDLLSYLQLDRASLGFDYIRICESGVLKVKDCMDFEQELSAKISNDNSVLIKLEEDRSQIYLESLGIKLFC